MPPLIYALEYRIRHLMLLSETWIEVTQNFPIRLQLLCVKRMRVFTVYLFFSAERSCMLSALTAKLVSHSSRVNQCLHSAARG
jgi:hypothetical protein